MRGHENKNKNKTSQNSVFSAPSSAPRREQFHAPPNENSQYAYEIPYLLYVANLLYMRIREGMRVYVRAYWETVPRLAERLNEWCIRTNTPLGIWLQYKVLV